MYLDLRVRRAMVLRVLQTVGVTLNVLCSPPGDITLSSITANWDQTLEIGVLIRDVLYSQELERSTSNLP